MGPTRSLANCWGGGRKILDMYLTLIETYWWGDGDDDGDDKKMWYLVNKYSTLDNLVYIHIHILNLVCGTYFYE